MVGFAFIAYTMVALPVQVSFALDDSTTPAVTTLEILVDVFFIADIVLNFHTAFVSHGNVLIVDKPAITKNYLTTWFAVDVASSIPWEVILLAIFQTSSLSDDGGNATNSGRDGDARLASLGALKVLKLPKVLRLGRVLRLVMKMKRVGIVGKIVMLIVGVALLTHWLCAMWFVLVQRSGGTWREDAGAPDDDASTADQHAFYFYQTMMMVMGDGTGPTNQIEVVFTCFCVLLGACVNAAVFANVAWLVSQMSATNAFHVQRMANIDAAMKRVGVKPKTANRVRAYYEYRWQCHRDHEVDEFVSTLPAQLRSDVSCLLHWRLIRKCPLFATADRRLVAAVSTALQPEVYLPSEFILVAGYVSSCMYLIARGRVLVVEKMMDDSKTSSLRMSADDLDDQLTKFAEQSMETTQPVKAKSKWMAAAKRIASGVREDYFGERGLLSPAEQHAHEVKNKLQRCETSARALTHVDLFRLQRQALEAVLAQYPKPSVQLIQTAHSEFSKDFAQIFEAKVMKIVGEGAPATDAAPPKVATESVPPPPTPDPLKSSVINTVSPPFALAGSADVRELGGPRTPDLDAQTKTTSGTDDEGQTKKRNRRKKNSAEPPVTSKHSDNSLTELSNRLSSLAMQVETISRTQQAIAAHLGVGAAGGAKPVGTDVAAAKPQAADAADTTLLGTDVAEVKPMGADATLWERHCRPSSEVGESCSSSPVRNSASGTSTGSPAKVTSEGTTDAPNLEVPSRTVGTAGWSLTENSMAWAQRALGLSTKPLDPLEA